MEPDAPPEGPLPTFLIIGAQKSATRWLRSNLGLHPDVFTADEELSFFNQRYRRGLDYYRSQFEGWSGEPIVGEATPGYMMWKHRPERVAKRIKETLPDVRLIALLRDPVERANSAVLHHVRRGRLKKRTKLVNEVESRDPEDDPLCLVSGGWYAASLQPYVDLFADQLLVLLHDDIAEDARWVYRTALTHIGADPDFVPDTLEEVVHSNRTRSTKAISDDDRRRLWAYFEDDVVRLEPLVGRDLSIWRPEQDMEIEWPSADRLLRHYPEAMDWVQSRVEGVSPDLYDEALPFTEGTVRELLVRMVSVTAFNVRAFHPRGHELAPDIARRQFTDLPGAFAEARELLDATLEMPAFSKRAAHIAGGMRPAPLHLSGYLVNQLVLAWELAVATGQDPAIPAEVAEEAERYTREASDALSVREWLPEAVEVDDASSPSDRLVAFYGRDPALAASGSGS